MRHPFVELPGERTSLPRPALPVQLENHESPAICLLDSGATANRFDAELAGPAGLPLDDPLDTTVILVGGLRTTGRCLRVDLTVAGHRYEAPVWFCDPWPFGFGLLGQEGFFRFFRVTICAAEGWLECVPEPL